MNNIIDIFLKSLLESGQTGTGGDTGGGDAGGDAGVDTQYGTGNDSPDSMNNTDDSAGTGSKDNDDWDSDDPDDDTKDDKHKKKKNKSSKKSHIRVTDKRQIIKKDKKKEHKDDDSIDYNERNMTRHSGTYDGATRWDLDTRYTTGSESMDHKKQLQQLKIVLDESFKQSAIYGTILSAISYLLASGGVWLKYRKELEKLKDMLEKCDNDACAKMVKRRLDTIKQTGRAIRISAAAGGLAVGGAAPIVKNQANIILKLKKDLSEAKKKANDQLKIWHDKKLQNDKLEELHAKLDKQFNKIPDKFNLNPQEMKIMNDLTDVKKQIKTSREQAYNELEAYKRLKSEYNQLVEKIKNSKYSFVK